jgi:hypothetical protein
MTRPAKTFALALLALSAFALQGCLATTVVGTAVGVAGTAAKVSVETTAATVKAGAAVTGAVASAVTGGGKKKN